MDCHDTILSDDEMITLGWNVWGAEANRNIVEAQAKITWDAAIREVADWVEEQGYETFRTGYYPSQEMWKAQKKRWGINEKS